MSSISRAAFRRRLDGLVMLPPAKGKQMNKYALFDDLPECCKSCAYRDWDARDEYSPAYNYCTKNLILPTKQGKCKKHKEWCTKGDL